MSVTLYHYPKSAPSRAALLVARSLSINVDVQIVDLFSKEQLKPEYIKVSYEFRLCFENIIINLYIFKLVYIFIIFEYWLSLP